MSGWVGGWVGGLPDAEGGQQTLSFAFFGATIDRVSPKELGVFGEGVDGVGKNDDFVALLNGWVGGWVNELFCMC